MTTAGPDEPVVLTEAEPLAIVELRDEVGRNQLTPSLRAGLIAAVRRAGANPRIRAIVLEGLPDVFCAGGSIESMLGSHQERVVEMWTLMRSILDCPIPLVAAVRGHALGGGLLLALYCDVAVFSERSRYAVNFSLYGFTPVLGSTYIVPAVLGQALGLEMLYTGQSYAGRALADRGAGVRVTGHDQVPETARRIALQIARAPRQYVELLKARLAGSVCAAAEAALAGEIPDHDTTIGADEARRRIRALHTGHRGVPARPVDEPWRHDHGG